MDRQERIEMLAEAIEELENLEPRIASLEARMSNMVVVVDGILRREQAACEKNAPTDGGAIINATAVREIAREVVAEAFAAVAPHASGMRGPGDPPHLRGNGEPFEEGGAGAGPNTPPAPEPIKVGDWVVREEDNCFGKVAMIHGDLVRLKPNSHPQKFSRESYAWAPLEFCRRVPESEIRSILAGVEAVARCCGPLVRYGTRKPCFARVGDLARTGRDYSRVVAINAAEAVEYEYGGWDRASDVQNVVRGEVVS